MQNRDNFRQQLVDGEIEQHDRRVVTLTRSATSGPDLRGTASTTPRPTHGLRPTAVLLAVFTARPIAGASADAGSEREKRDKIERVSAFAQPTAASFPGPQAPAARRRRSRATRSPLLAEHDRRVAGGEGSACTSRSSVTAMRRTNDPRSGARASSRVKLVRSSCSSPGDF